MSMHKSLDLIKEYFFDGICIVTAMVGSLLVASNSEYTMYGFVLFLISSVITSFYLFKQKSRSSLLIIQVWYVAVNAYGIINYSKVIQ